MKSTRRQTAIAATTFRSRRGTIVAWTVMGILFGGICLAFAVNFLWVTGVRADSRRCAEAAALAAAQSLLSDDLLRQQTYPVEHRWRLELSRDAALSIASQYQRLQSVAPVEPDSVEFLGAETQGDVPRAVRVSFASNGQSARIPLFLSGITGLRSATNGMSCLVELQNTPVALQPTIHVSVPMLPVVLMENNEEGGNTWSQQIEQYKGSDRYAWVRERNEIEEGPDGLPELTVVTDWSNRDISVELRPLQFEENCTDQQMMRRFVEGITREDVQLLNREVISFPSLGQMDLELDCSPAAMFERVVGLPRILCLAKKQAADEEASDADSGSSVSVELMRPVAARVMNVRVLSATRVAVTLQPCVLSTVTAVHGPGADANRYVYSVRPRY